VRFVAELEAVLAEVGKSHGCDAKIASGGGRMKVRAATLYLNYYYINYYYIIHACFARADRRPALTAPDNHP
jgi:hypothetical protein